MKKQDRFDIQRMFMAQASPDRCFYGVLKEYQDGNCNICFFSRIKVNEGCIMAVAGDRKLLSKVLDEMCRMVLDSGVHKDSGIVSKIYADEFYLN